MNYAPISYVRDGMRIVFALLFTFAFVPVSEAQNNHLFEQGRALYVSAALVKGKRIVSGIQVEARDSTKQEIHVRMDLLKDWVSVDSAEFDLFLDTTAHEFISIDKRKYEAIRYHTKDGEVTIHFEKPKGFTHTTKEGVEWTHWSSSYATVNYSNRFKKYNRILKVYYEK